MKQNSREYRDTHDSFCNETEIGGNMFDARRSLLDLHEVAAFLASITINIGTVQTPTFERYETLAPTS